MNDRLPSLPDGFWNKADLVEQLWREMMIQIGLEWEALKKQDLVALWKIAEKKTRLSNKILLHEHQLSQVIDAILERCGLEPGNKRWRAIMGLLHSQDVERLQNWLSRIRLLKKEAFETNRRHMKWVRERLSLIQDLTGIMSGKRGDDAPVYDISGRLSGLRGLFERPRGPSATNYHAKGI